MNHHQRHLWLFPLLLVLYEISSYLSNDMYLPALPSMMRDLNLSAASAQLTVTMWFLGAACSPLLSGALADRFGRRATLLVGGAVYVISSMLCAIAISEYTLLLPRIIQGAVISTMMVAGYAVIHELYEHKTAIRILGVMGSISILAPALGPMLGAVILLFASWRVIFWFIAGYSALTLFFLYHHMPETLPVDQRHPLHLRTLLHHYRQIIFNRDFIILMLILGLPFAGFISWITSGPILVIEDLHYTAIAFGWMQAAVFSVYILGSQCVNWFADICEANKLVNIGLSISFLAGLMLSLVACLLPQHFNLFLMALIVYSFGSALSFAPLNRLIIETSQEPMGMRVACFTAGLMGAGILGSAIISMVYNGTVISLALVMTISITLAALLRVLA